MKNLLIIAATFFILHSQFSIAAPAPVPQTGQTTCYNTTCAGSGQDGAIKSGVALPVPRFSDNGNGSVTDNLTGLVWLKNANCFNIQAWATAVASAKGLASGACGLTDGSSAGTWRLPSIKELESLVDLQNINPALPTGHPFTSVQSAGYWSGSSYSSNYAWDVGMFVGYVYYSRKGNYDCYVWPVRSVQ